MTKRRRVRRFIPLWEIVILAVAVVVILDDDPTVWEKTQSIVERVLFGGLFSD